MKDINALTLNPSCSEYVHHLELTEEEKKLARKIAKSMKLNKDKYFMEHLDMKEGIHFTNTEDVEPYNRIKIAVLAKRKGVGEGEIKEIMEEFK